MIIYENRLKNYSRKLRKEMTPAEAYLWTKLRKRQLSGYRFLRQKPIDAFIVDFYCHELSLVIEIDGSSHNEKKYDYDRSREVKLQDLGFKILRFTEYEVRHNMRNVLETVHNFIEKKI